MSNGLKSCWITTADLTCSRMPVILVVQLYRFFVIAVIENSSLLRLPGIYTILANEIFNNLAGLSMRILKVFIIAMFVSSGLIKFANAAADGWLTQFKLKSATRKMKRAGMYPVSAVCRNSPKAKVTIRPEIKVVWKKNTAKRSWALYMYKGQMDFKPYPAVSSKEWKRIYGKIVRSGNASYRCSLWHKKR